MWRAAEGVHHWSVTHTEIMTEPSEEVSLDSDIHYTYGLYEIIYRVMGLWPFNCQTMGAWFLSIFTCVSQISMMVTMTGETILSNSQVDPQLMSFLSCNFLSLAKIGFIRLNWLQLQSVLQELISAWKGALDPKALKIMRTRAKFGRMIFIYQMGSTYMVCLLLIIPALPVFIPTVNDTMNATSLRSYPLRSDLLFAGIPTWLYVFMFIYQMIQVVLTCTANVGNDVCFFGIALNLAAQFECLAIKWEAMTEKPREMSGENTFSAVITKQIKLIQLAEYLEKTFNLVILCIVSANCSQICFYGILVIRTARAKEFVFCINTIISIMVLVFQIFLYCYAGDSLSRSIENVGTAAYNCLWYEMSPENKKNLVFIIVRTSKIFSLTAGKIYRMDLYSFKTIIKTIASYFSVMQALFEE